MQAVSTASPMAYAMVPRSVALMATFAEVMKAVRMAEQLVEELAVWMVVSMASF